MPYIKRDRRKQYDSLIKELAQKIAKINVDNCDQFCGDWNYVITKLIKETRTAEGCSPSYSQWNEVIGMLECCKLEIYRRKVAPYEDKKIKVNGDVY